MPWAEGARAVGPVMRVTVLEDLDLERLDVVHAGERTFPLARKVRAVAAGELLDQIEPLRRP
jgi:hypothetical protein